MPFAFGRLSMPFQHLKSWMSQTTKSAKFLIWEDVKRYKVKKMWFDSLFTWKCTAIKR